VSGCVRHPFESALTQCARCADRLCATCWVEARRKILCVDCALALAGVRSSGRSGKSAASYRRRLNESTEAGPLEWDEIDLREWKERAAKVATIDLTRSEAETPAG
jgi:hypothetical protein